MDFFNFLLGNKHSKRRNYCLCFLPIVKWLWAFSHILYLYTHLGSIKLLLYTSASSYLTHELLLKNCSLFRTGTFIKTLKVDSVHWVRRVFSGSNVSSLIKVTFSSLFDERWSIAPTEKRLKKSLGWVMTHFSHWSPDEQNQPFGSQLKLPKLTVIYRKLGSWMGGKKKKKDQLK